MRVILTDVEEGHELNADSSCILLEYANIKNRVVYSLVLHLPDFHAIYTVDKPSYEALTKVFNDAKVGCITIYFEVDRIVEIDYGSEVEDEDGN